MVDLKGLKSWLDEHAFTKICLQLNENWLPESLSLKTVIEGLGVKVIFTQTGCCVNPLNHAQVDAIVHFGHSCCSTPSVTLPIFYIFDVKPLNLTLLQKSLKSLSGPVLVLYDTAYHHAMPCLQKLVGKDVVLSTLSTEWNPSSPLPMTRQYTPMDLSQTTLVYIGESSLAMTNVFMTHHACKELYIYDPTTNSLVKESIVKSLGRRYYLVQKAKEAEMVGLVIGTNNIGSSIKVVNELSNLLKSKGKKPYLISVGQPNPAKLGNFLELEVFVMVSCPESTLLDDREFMKPVLTPFEMMVALGDAVWNSSYLLDIGSVQESLASVSLDPPSKTKKGECWQDESSDEEPEFSLISGGYKCSRAHSQIVYEESHSNDTNALTVPSSTVSKFLMDSPASRYLNSKRTYLGLEQNLGSELAQLEIGRSGVASGYTHEPSKSIL